MRIIYPSKGNKKDSNGRLIVAPSFFYKDHMNTIQTSHRHDVVPGDINIYDTLVDQNCKLYGGEYWISSDTVNNVHEDDIIELSIIDKDDVLGYFGAYGLSKDNGDILELTKFVIDEYVKKGNPSDGYHTDLVSAVKGVSDIPVGLYVRTYYFSYGTENVRFISKLFKYL